MTERARRNTALMLIVGVLICAVIAGWLFWQRGSGDNRDERVGDSGLPVCALNSLPPQAADTVRLIHSGGPFRYPRHDGDVFGNREGHLPSQRPGFYHEYTVPDPAASSRSVRRIVTGGGRLDDPAQYFYTGDHYDSFCEIVGAE